MFAQTGKVDFWGTSSSLVINSQSHMLVSSIASLATAITSSAADVVTI
jgi:hypothetical protein